VTLDEITMVAAPSVRGCREELLSGVQDVGERRLDVPAPPEQQDEEWRRFLG